MSVDGVAGGGDDVAIQRFIAKQGGDEDDFGGSWLWHLVFLLV
jgi:hypothetical protein